MFHSVAFVEGGKNWTRAGCAGSDHVCLAGERMYALAAQTDLLRGEELCVRDAANRERRAGGVRKGQQAYRRGLLQ